MTSTGRGFNGDGGGQDQFRRTRTQPGQGFFILQRPPFDPMAGQFENPSRPPGIDAACAKRVIEPLAQGGDGAENRLAGQRFVLAGVDVPADQGTLAMGETAFCRLARILRRDQGGPCRRRRRSVAMKEPAEHAIILGEFILEVIARQS
jgi:hypothetical protein